MTKKQIENLPAGRELDALIAVEFFDWRWLSSKKNAKKLSACFPPNSGYEMIPEDWSPSDASGERFRDWDKIKWFDRDEKMIIGFLHYSTDIAAAWTLVEKISKMHYWEIESPFHLGEKWFAGITPHDCSGWNGRPDFQASAETAPLAICRAALMWKLGQESLQ